MIIRNERERRSSFCLLRIIPAPTRENSVAIVERQTEFSLCAMLALLFSLAFTLLMLLVVTCGTTTLGTV